MSDTDDSEVVDLLIVPANQAAAADLDMIYGTRGVVSNCRCQWFKLGKKESLSDIGPEGLRDRQLTQAGCGEPDRATTSGLVGYLNDEPVAWCAVEPRCNYVGMLRATYRVPWVGRDEDKADRSVWAITCLYTRVGYRDRGISTLMATAAVGFARQRGAAAVEAYPITHGALSYERRAGTPATFGAAGLSELHQPSKRRMVMRIDFSNPSEQLVSRTHLVNRRGPVSPIETLTPGGRCHGRFCVAWRTASGTGSRGVALRGIYMLLARRLLTPVVAGGCVSILVPCIGRSDFATPGRVMAAGSSTRARSAVVSAGTAGGSFTSHQPANALETSSCRTPTT